MVDKTVCALPSEDCYDRRCDNCCNINVSDIFITDTDIDEQAHTAWSLWTVTNNHVELQHLNGSFRSLIDQLNVRWPAIVTHCYVTRQQRDYIKSIKITSSFSTFAVAQMDFAENFSFVVQNEIQSAYWNQKQATVYIGLMQKYPPIFKKMFLNDVALLWMRGFHAYDTASVS